MSKEDILLINDYLNNKELKEEDLNNLKIKIEMIVKQIKLQEEMTNLTNKLQDMNNKNFEIVEK